MYDVIVVGAGHAGCEAAAAAANMGCSTLLITMNLAATAQMSCNPAMGGVAKGQIVREIDALGGYSGVVTDLTMIQFRMLNRKKGPAMWSPRAQCDRMRFAETWRTMLEKIPKLDFRQEIVTGLCLVNDGGKRRVTGVYTGLGRKIEAKAVVLTNGTFLNGRIHVGEKHFSGGRSGEKAAHGLTEQLAEAGFVHGRMKTGTPPRLDGRTIDYSRLEIQPGDEPPGKFSFTDVPPLENQLPCHIAYTNPAVHDILEEGFDRSPMFSGRIQGTGPRYCPSIEDKIVRFADKDRHQLFVEPEGRHTIEVYLNGFSSSLPEEVQERALRKIEGFENVKMFRPGYAVEYDYFPPHQLHLSLETRPVENLFFAGQINGTTGYEEAAAQGIVAGINAALKIAGKPPMILRRDQAYIGVLIDDLINKSTDEPYRMFTSRAEYRITLRQDNADLRLTELSHNLGLADERRYAALLEKKQACQALESKLKSIALSPEQVNGMLERLGESPIREKTTADRLLVRPNVTLDDLRRLCPELDEFCRRRDVNEQVEIAVKYAGYIEKEAELAAKIKRLEDVALPENFNYHAVASLSNEAKQKLSQIKPRSLGQASRISGIRPSDISVLMVYIGR
ncbi:MAG: tRNA uridine-5-carboxymethylaminomethyl(34) synthesis enzyme MnmG [Bacteroidia bacterium]|nr:tRNA uridine-5-carboxymethylaminomethyl(34) synthesis enzyme MnmG [Bacteroidia bacterium]MDW8332974.1 tRNA uridine-5-carboxymethylaminomethyl(34) synthesis enzyme MnmG [Bacteroidia bacterium]